MHWNHRVVRFLENGDVCWQIAEVHYDSQGQPIGWCDADVVVFASDETADPDPIAALRKQVEWYRQALEQPVLDAAEIEQRGARGAWIAEAGPFTRIEHLDTQGES